MEGEFEETNAKGTGYKGGVQWILGAWHPKVSLE